MKKNTRITLISAAIIVLFSSVWAFAAAGSGEKTAQDNNAFAFDIFSSLCNSEAGKNVFISPYSISCALAMCYDGAKKATAAQTAKAMHFPLDKKTLRTGFTALQKLINTKDKPYELASANSLWPQRGFGFLPDYMNTIAKYYDGRAEEVDYGSDKTGAIQKINAWTSEHTKGKIPEIVGPDEVNELTRMILVNAVYFKGAWAEKFNPKNTGKGVFYIAADKKKSVDMMNAKLGAGYTEQDGVKALEMRYAGGDISMIAVLPAEKDTLKLEKTLTYAVFKKWLAGLATQKVDVSFPKFKLHSLYSLNNPLAGLGMKDAFDENLADFSGMTGKKNLYITDVIHAGFVDVNEEGTEAAAATAVVMGTKSIEMNPEFIADRPFLFFIYDRAADTILFMGRMNEPKAEGEK